MGDKSGDQSQPKKQETYFSPGAANNFAATVDLSRPLPFQNGAESENQVAPSLLFSGAPHGNHDLLPHPLENDDFLDSLQGSNSERNSEGMCRRQDFSQSFRREDEQKQLGVLPSPSSLDVMKAKVAQFGFQQAQSSTSPPNANIPEPNSVLYSAPTWMQPFLNFTGCNSSVYVMDQGQVRPAATPVAPLSMASKKRKRPQGEQEFHHPMKSLRRRRAGCASKYRGVTYHRKDKRWIARVWVNKKTVNLGSFQSEVDAARAVRDKYHQICDDVSNLDGIYESAEEEQQ